MRSSVRSSASRMCFIPTVAGGPTVFCATSASMYATLRPSRNANAAVARASVLLPASSPPRNRTARACRAASSTSCSCSFIVGPPYDRGGPGCGWQLLHRFGVALAQVVVDVVLAEPVAPANPERGHLPFLDQPIDGHPGYAQEVSDLVHGQQPSLGERCSHGVARW